MAKKLERIEKELKKGILLEIRLRHGAKLDIDESTSDNILIHKYWGGSNPLRQGKIYCVGYVLDTQFFLQINPIKDNRPKSEIHFDQKIPIIQIDYNTIYSYRIIKTSYIPASKKHFSITSSGQPASSNFALISSLLIPAVIASLI
jgi:hypothetical protein